MFWRQCCLYRPYWQSGGIHWWDIWYRGMQATLQRRESVSVSNLLRYHKLPIQWSLLSAEKLRWKSTCFHTSNLYFYFYSISGGMSRLRVRAPHLLSIMHLCLHRKNWRQRLGPCYRRRLRPRLPQQLPRPPWLHFLHVFCGPWTVLPALRAAGAHSIMHKLSDWPRHLHRRGPLSHPLQWNSAAVIYVHRHSHCVCDTACRWLV